MSIKRKKISALAEPIFDVPFRDDDMRKAENFISGFKHPATALYVLSMVFANDYEDGEGSDILYNASVDMAELDASRET